MQFFLQDMYGSCKPTAWLVTAWVFQDPCRHMFSAFSNFSADARSVRQSCQSYPKLAPSSNRNFSLKALVHQKSHTHTHTHIYIYTWMCKSSLLQMLFKKCSCQLGFKDLGAHMTTFFCRVAALDLKPSMMNFSSSGPPK